MTGPVRVAGADEDVEEDNHNGLELVVVMFELVVPLVEAVLDEVEAVVVVLGNSTLEETTELDVAIATDELELGLLHGIASQLACT